MIKQDIHHEIRRILMASFITARALPKELIPKGIYQYDFDNASAVMDQFKALTTAAIRSKLNSNAPNN